MLPLKKYNKAKNATIYGTKNKLPTQSKHKACTVCGKPGTITTIRSGRGHLVLCKGCKSVIDKKDELFKVSFTRASELK